MKAMVLAAGLGTRLRPLTDSKPKALVTIGGKTLLEITLATLRSFGVDEVIVNVHHFADQICEYLDENGNFGMRIEISHEEGQLLDTGGGLKKAAWFFLKDAADPLTNSTMLADLKGPDFEPALCLPKGAENTEEIGGASAPEGTASLSSPQTLLALGHDFSRAENPEQTGRASAPEGSSSPSSPQTPSALKGHDFSRAENPEETGGASAPEGSSSSSSPQTLSALKRH
ncbi:MAG TPA: sugar phosphate nucleotidyltransferase, partial [Terracidiphilus sp.]